MVKRFLLSVLIGLACIYAYTPAAMAEDATGNASGDASGDAAKDTTEEARGYWTDWRGPLGTGVAPDRDAPVKFSATENVKWKTEIPGVGFSSPIIWRDRIFLTSAVAKPDPSPPAPEPASAPQGRRRGRRRPLVPQQLLVLCIDRGSGEVVWRRTAKEVMPHEGHHPRLSSYANASVVTDGEYIYAFFGSFGLYCYDMDGNLQWERAFDVKMRMYNTFGESSTPALSGNSLVLQFDHEDQSFVEAVDKRTGDTLWKKQRDEETSWSSPYAFEHDGIAQVVLSGANFLTSYDPATGDEIWKCAGLTTHPVPTPVYSDGFLYATCGTGGRKATVVIRMGGTGDLSGTDAVVWTMQKGSSYNPSPLVWGDELYLVNDGGFMPGGSGKMGSFDAKTGEQHYFEQRLSGAYTVKASPIGVADKIYICTEEGDVLVLQRGKEYKVLAINQMEERFIATPAFVEDEIFLRGDKNLYCISEK